MPKELIHFFLALFILLMFAIIVLLISPWLEIYSGLVKARYAPTIEQQLNAIEPGTE